MPALAEVVKSETPTFVQPVVPDVKEAKEKAMAMQRQQLRRLIEEVLKELELYSEAAVEQLMLTCAVESNLGTWLWQLETETAQGIFQMEPTTEKDIWKNFLKYKPELAARVKEVAGDGSDLFALKANLVYQIAMARVHYLRVKAPLPDANNVEAMAKYWKDHYNTKLGKGTVEKAVEHYEVYAV
jgi:hypothetical protein